MAVALVYALRPSNSPLLPDGCAIICGCAFWGADVPNGTRGQPFEVLARISQATYTLADLRAAVSSAVQAKAADLGLTLDAGGVDMLSFESDNSI